MNRPVDKVTLCLRLGLASTPAKDPEFWVHGRLSTDEQIKLADPCASRAMVALMDMNAVIGGAASHYGGPAAFAEIMSSIHGYMYFMAKKKQKEWFELFNFINDAGHCENGLYALKANYGFAGLTLADLRKFRSIESVLTGHGESHLFPEAVLLSNGPLGSALPQSQGLAMADRHSENSRVTIAAISDGACMEGEAREALASIPGLAAKDKLAPFVLVISDNNTKLSGRIDQDCFSMLPTFNSLATMGWSVINVNDGHDLQKMLEAVEKAVDQASRNPKIPVVIHAMTIKGCGHKKSADSASGGHGFSLKSAKEIPEMIKEIYALRPAHGAGAHDHSNEIPVEFSKWSEELLVFEEEIKQKTAALARPLVAPAMGPEEKIQNGIANAMIGCRKDGAPLISITSDLPGSTGVAAFRKEFPKDSFDVGIAESNMVSVAAGFSKLGYTPIVDTFAQFGVTKGALPLTMAALSEAPVICIYSHTGFQDAADGASHQALSYFSMTASIPHVEVYALSCSEEAESLLKQAIKQFEEDRKQEKVPPSFVFFLGRENFPRSYGVKNYKLRAAQVILDNTTPTGQKAVTIVAPGSMLGEALKASLELLRQNVESIVINPGCLNHLDVAVFSSAVKKTKGKIVTVEDHQMIGGYGATLTHQLMTKLVSVPGVDAPLHLKSLAVQGEFGQSAYNAIELYRKHHLDADAIVQAALEL